MTTDNKSAISEPEKMAKVLLNFCEKGFSDQVLVDKSVLRKIAAALDARPADEHRNAININGPLGFVNEQELRKMLSGDAAQCKLSRMKRGCMTSPVFARPAVVSADAVKELFQPWAADETGPTDEPESQYRFGYNTAIEDALDALGVISPVPAETQSHPVDAKVGRALIASGIYDRMSDMTSHDEPAALIQELIAAVDPILEAEWGDRLPASPAPIHVSDESPREQMERLTREFAVRPDILRRMPAEGLR